MSLSEIRSIVDAHEQRRRTTINLVASENRMSPAALRMLGCDFTHRYCIPPADQRPASIWDYPNQRYVREIEDVAERLACQVLGGVTADVRPLSGNNAAYILLQAVLLEGDEVASVAADCGGHFATDVICRRERFVRHDLPYRRELGQVDVEATIELCRRHPIKLVFLDASMQLFPHPVHALRAALPDVLIAYDASHLMGIIAGGQFQDPIAEGADIIQGSTHKSLFGPQKALFVFAAAGTAATRIRDLISPLFVSNTHPHHIAALAVALQEMCDFGKEYAARVVANARALAGRLHAAGEQVSFPELGFTDCHQFAWRIGARPAAQARWRALERAGLHVNLVRVPFGGGQYGFRIGVAEITRRGMGPADMAELAQLILSVQRVGPARTRGKVARFSGRFRGLSFGYDSDGAVL